MTSVSLLGSYWIDSLILQAIGCCLHLRNWVFNTQFIGLKLHKQARMKFSTKNTEVLCLSSNLNQQTLRVSGNTLQHVEKFKYRGLVFVSRHSKEIDTRIGKAKIVLHEL